MPINLVLYRDVMKKIAKRRGDMADVEELYLRTVAEMNTVFTFEDGAASLDLAWLSERKEETENKRIEA